MHAPRVPLCAWSPLEEELFVKKHYQIEKAMFPHRLSAPSPPHPALSRCQRLTSSSLASKQDRFAITPPLHPFPTAAVISAVAAAEVLRTSCKPTPTSISTARVELAVIPCMYPFRGTPFLIRVRNVHRSSSPHHPCLLLCRRHRRRHVLDHDKADSVKLYEIGEGVNRIRVRAHDAETELYDLAPAEVVWVRDATAPQLDWLWTPEEVG